MQSGQPSVSVAATSHPPSADLLEPPGGDPNAFLPVIAGAGGDAKGLFSADALAGYGKAIGRDVRADEAQSVLNQLMVANVVMRRGHGHSGLTDPFVQEIWAERSALMLAPVGKN